MNWFKKANRSNVTPNIDPKMYPKKPGLEGPFRLGGWKIVYYDPKEGAYWDPKTDIYLSNEEMQNLNQTALADSCGNVKTSGRKWKKTKGIPHAKDQKLKEKIRRLKDSINPVTDKEYNRKEVSDQLGISWQTVNRIFGLLNEDEKNREDETKSLPKP